MQVVVHVPVRDGVVSLAHKITADVQHIAVWSGFDKVGDELVDLSDLVAQPVAELPARQDSLAITIEIGMRYGC